MENIQLSYQLTCKRCYRRYSYS